MIASRIGPMNGKTGPLGTHLAHRLIATFTLHPESASQRIETRLDLSDIWGSLRTGQPVPRGIWRCKSSWLRDPQPALPYANSMGLA